METTRVVRWTHLLLIVAPLLTVLSHLTANTVAPQLPAITTNPVPRRRIPIRASGLGHDPAPHRASRCLRLKTPPRRLVASRRLRVALFDARQGGAGAIGATEGCLDVLTGPFHPSSAYHKLSGLRCTLLYRVVV